MPELPEVQTVINYLKDNILNETIIDVEIKMEKFLKNSTVDEFKKVVNQSKIIDIKRIGKYLVFVLSNDWFLISHLRMEGKYFIDSEIKNRKHDYLIFKLTNNKYLTYNDSRQFGTFHISQELKTLKEINKIAIDPLDKKFNTDFLYEKAKKSKKNIKTFLLDQNIVSGIGNIYASEILFAAKISPFKSANEIDKNDINLIVKYAKLILEKAIKYHGTTAHSYSFGTNKKGEYGQFLQVMYREKQNCFSCNQKIKRIKQQARSTFYCAHCQK